MRNYAMSVAAVSFMAMAAVAHADAKGLAETKQCLSCHAVDKEMGNAPAFKAIAKKYKGVANIELELTQKLKVGGVGHWGASPMPPAGGGRPLVSDAEAKELVAWVLAQR